MSMIIKEHKDICILLNLTVKQHEENVWGNASVVYNDFAGKARDWPSSDW